MTLILLGFRISGQSISNIGVLVGLAETKSRSAVDSVQNCPKTLLIILDTSPWRFDRLCVFYSCVWSGQHRSIS